jgi:site-specific DNA recombinase
MKTASPAKTLPVVRAAIYTRKSTEEGLEQQFNSLDAQRESAEAFVRSQAHEGWTCLPERYDDGGFTGGNMDRPALRRLLNDIEAGQVNCVVVYKVDRLSRSLLDFARIMQVFETHQVSFVSVTQSFNTSTSMGRLVLNILTSFAQFERELISERTRDKVAATRRKGKWSGGRPILGYDVDQGRQRLLVNEDEAVLVRAIFDLYVHHKALLPVVQELERRGWTNKCWQTRSGRPSGGTPLTKTALYRLLTNVIYMGKSRYKAEIHAGEHQAIVPVAQFERVQELLRRNGRTRGAPVRNKFGALLKGMLRCVSCDCAMTPATTKRGTNRRYRYYVCTSAQKRGWHTCPSKSVPANEIETLVVQQLRNLGGDAGVLHATLEEARRQDDVRLLELDAEQRELERELARWHGEAQKWACSGDGATATGRLADAQDRITLMERRLGHVKEEGAVVRRERIGEDEVAGALSAFTPMWDSLTPSEHTQIVHLLVQRVDFDGPEGKVRITFQPAGIKTLANQMAEKQAEERIA